MFSLGREKKDQPHDTRMNTLGWVLGHFCFCNEIELLKIKPNSPFLLAEEGMAGKEIGSIVHFWVNIFRCLFFFVSRRGRRKRAYEKKCPKVQPPRPFWNGRFGF